LLRQPSLGQIAERHATTAAQVVLAWALRQPGLIAIPKAVEPVHLRLNAAAAALQLTAEDLAQIDAAFAVPTRHGPLAMI
jgi:diketogulonate reductase-like aldo/keto reductase